MEARRRGLVVMLALAAVTVLVYGRVATFESTSYDDPEFIGKPQVRQGLTRQSLRWAMTEVVANWHPVTTLSHLVDAQLFGRRVGLHHLTNLALHVANTLLLFVLLQR